MAIPIQFIPEIPESKLSPSVQIKLNTNGGTSNSSIRVATTQSHLTTPLTGQEKEISIQGNITLTSNITFAANAIISDGGGTIDVNGKKILFVNNSFNFPNERLIFDFSKNTAFTTYNYTATGGETSLNLAVLIDTKFNYIFKVNGAIQKYGTSDGLGQSYTITQGTTTTLNFYNEISPLTTGDVIEVKYVLAGNTSSVDPASTFSNPVNVNFTCFGAIGDGNTNTNTGTDNRNVFLEATRIANLSGGKVINTKPGKYMTSAVATRGSYGEPFNWYITNGVDLISSNDVEYGLLTTENQTDNELLAIWDTQYSYVIGGKFTGDLKTHKFLDTHDEGNHGIRLCGNSSTKYNFIKDVKFEGFVADAIYSEFNPEFIHFNAITSATLTKAFTLDDSGVPEANDDYAYSQLLSLANFHGVNPMVVGGGSFSGNLGLDNQTYYAYYYDGAGNFIEKSGLLKFYQPVPIADNYEQVRIVIHTPIDNYVDFDSKPGITVFSPSRPTYTTVDNCHITYSYRNGISNLSYGSKLLNTTIEYTGKQYNGTTGALGLGTDLEDSYNNIQNVEIAYNTFVNNYRGNLTLIGSVDCNIHDNKFIYNNDPSFGTTQNSIAMYQASRAQFYNNLVQGGSITVARQSEIFNSNLQDTDVLLYENKETFRDNSNLLNVNLLQTTVDKYNQVSYVRNNVFKYTKLTNTAALRNSLNWIAENNVWDFGEVAISTTSTGNNKLQYNDSNASSNYKMISNQGQSTVSKGYFKNFVIKNLIPTIGDEWDVYFKWGVVDMDDFRIETNLNILSGGSKNATYKNGYIGGRLKFELAYYPATNTGTFNTLTFENITIEIPSNDYLLYLNRASLFNSEAKDVNFVFKNCHFIMPDVANDNKWFDLLHYGKVDFETCTFESKGTSTASLASSSTCDTVTFKDCKTINTTLTLRAGDKLLYTVPNTNCPSYADNATALAALGEGWYYKNTTSGKFDITNL